MNKKLFVILMVLIGLPHIFIFSALPGTLDTTFNTGGAQPGTAVTPNIDGYSLENVGESVAIQTDGKIVLSGFAEINGINQFAVARFNTDGTLDTTFNAGGAQPGTAVTPSIDGYSLDNFAYSVAIQTDGKIVLGGAADINGSNQFAVARFNTDGTLDTTFNTGGAQPGTAVTPSIDSYAADNFAYSVAIQTDGKIVLGGAADINGSNQFAVARFNTDGTLDTTFNTGGAQPGTAVTPNIDGYSLENVGESVAIQTDGKIVLGGRAIINGIYQFAVARFNTDGTLDTTFNAGGAQPGTAVTPSIDSYAADNFAYSVAIQTDGKIVLGGAAHINGIYQFAVARFNTDGTLDTTFNAGGAQPGTAVTPSIDSYAADNFAYSVAIQTDGKIVLGGAADINGPSQFAVARFNTDGTLDTTFNAGGAQPGTAVTPSIDGYAAYNEASSLAIQTDGKIVLGGRAIINGINQFAVARFNGQENMVTAAPVLVSATVNAAGFVVVSGTGAQPDGSVFIILNSGMVIGTGIADASGNFTVISSSVAPAGLSIIAVTQLENTSLRSNNILIAVGLSLPSLFITQLIEKYYNR